MVSIGYIGSGDISYFHIAALREVGMEVRGIASRKNSDRLKVFSKKNKVKKIYPSIEELLIHDSDFDAYVVAIDIKATELYLPKILKKGKKILVEKPGAWNSFTLSEICKDANAKNLFFAYNRRFYNTIKKAKEFVKMYPSCKAVIHIPEPGGTISSFLSNGCHGIDLLLYLFPSAKIKYVTHHFYKKELTGFDAFIVDKNNAPITLLSHWKASSNFSIDLIFNDKRLLICPFEKAKEFSGIEIVEPNKDVPVREYNPKLRKETCVHTEGFGFKPGFINQYTIFKSFIKTKIKDNRICNSEQAIACLKFCEDLLPEGEFKL